MVIASRAGMGNSSLSQYFLPPLSLLVALAPACHTYQEGSFRSGGIKFPSNRTTHGCIDVGIAVREDAKAIGPVMDFHMGNRCRQGVWVDVAALEIRALLADGRQVPVTIADPRSEIRQALLGGLAAAHERLELEVFGEPTSICVTLDRFARGSSAGPKRTLCVPVEA